MLHSGSSAPQPARVTLARILRPRGRRGELAAEILTDFPERLSGLAEVFLAGGRGTPGRYALRRCWLHLGQAVFHFEGVDSIAAARALVGMEVQIPIEQRMPLPPGRYYITDLAGCEVWETRTSPERLGVVRDVQLTGEEVAGTPLLVVDSRQGELLIPLADEICLRIDLASRRIEVALPEGLRNLNRP